jgi:4-aminobutyrate aminotransferase-like enzyme
MDAQELRKQQKELLFPCVANYYDEPVVVAEANGVTVYDADGREYLDFFGGVLTVSLEHGQPDVVSAIQEQAATLSHISTLYITEPQLRVAARLAEIAPGDVSKSFFTNSGTEADETAVMLAKLHTGNQDMIVLRHGYSGRTSSATAMAGQKIWKPLPAQMPAVHHALSPYCYRCPLGLKPDNCGVRCAHDIEELINTTTPGAVAGFLAEPIQGSGGFIVPPPEYFEIAVDIVRKYGGVFISDEVQTGVGRTGTHWFGIEHWDVVPDIITMAKGLANGLPVGATLARPEVANSWNRALTFSTFGGNPIVMAAADATLTVMERENIPERSERLGQKLRAGLEELQQRHELIGDVRGKGLMQAIELVENRVTKEPATKKVTQLMEATKERGLLIGKAGNFGNVLRFAPPMLISEADLEEALRILDESLYEVTGAERPALVQLR